MAIEPDTKDWTWVLERPCDECGFDTRTFARETTGDILRHLTLVWSRTLHTTPDAAARPRDDVWSPLEYGCHVRDVIRLYDQRLQLMLTEDDPEYANWDQDATAIADDYGAQDPATVADEIAAAGADLADRFDAVRDRAWQRPGRRSDGARFTVETFARYFLHDIVHHLHDVAPGEHGSEPRPESFQG